MLCEIPRKQHSRLHAVTFQMIHNLTSLCSLPDRDQETEPARIRILFRNRKNIRVLRSPECFLEILEVLPSRLRELRQLFELCASDRRLPVRCFQIIAEMAVHILVVISEGQIAVLPRKTAAAIVVMTGRAYAVPSPVAHGAHDAGKERIIGIDRASLSHRHVMGRVEA